MNISSFDDLLLAARQQTEPQRLLLVFAGASLSADATPAQRAAFEAGSGGELAPLMCVDKTLEELSDFAALATEASAMLRPTGQDWVLAFASALSGPADNARVDTALQGMVEALRQGQLAGFIPFDRTGRAVKLG